ncbi:hypothetical protein B0T21DRAFT_386272 [Apiosordaria backusii]|uniref:CorA-like transporter domain-containing protein n=1 Tax=Apiosordaria backusii TaxID=314023 RepID=A0AA40DYQ4_9PEZI|nr:hypothetical protein B0T21DRAFT_386272 [Apiosordaria backusii]
MIDHYGKIEAACGLANTWPTNLFRSKTFRRELNSYRDQIHQEHKCLFDSNPRSTLVEFLEAVNGQDGYVSKECDSLSTLKDHFQVNRKDPKCRHVFFEADHSRAPLYCSKEMFLFTMSFLQVMAPFVDLLLGFGKSRSRKEFHYTSFRHENYLAASQAQSFASPRLGRSGQEVRHCYNLWGVEKTVIDDSPGWSIRQTAIFHSFDIVSGQALWVNISANDEIKSRITDAVASCEELQAESLMDLEGSFLATLKTHLVAFEWCLENWRQYITYLEKMLRNIIDEVEQAPVEEVERSLALDTKGLLRSLTAPAENFSQLSSPTIPTSPILSRHNTMNSASISRLKERTFTNLTGATIQSTSRAPPRATVPTSPIIGHTQSPPSAKQGKHRADQNRDPFDLLKSFSLDKLQELNGIGADLHTASLVMKLDSEVLINVLEYYEGLFAADEFPERIKLRRQGLVEFTQRTNSIVRCFEMERARIATLMLLLHDGKGLFEHILQFRNLEQGKLFNANAHLNQQRMEKFTADMHSSTLTMEKVTVSMHTIAEKTEKETASMHIITLVTLVFLPGTFVAVRLGLPTMLAWISTTILTFNQTFFGSGLFQWDDQNPLTSTPIWKGDFFLLFAKICFPLMAATILIWLLAYYWPHWRAYRRRQRSADEEQGGKDPEELGLMDDGDRQAKLK